MNHLTLPISLPALVASAFVVSFATVAVPGPITIVASRLALTRHLSAAILFLVGVTVLDIALFTALSSGAGPLLAQFGALPAVEVVGGIALIWAGIGAIRSKSQPQEPHLRVNPEQSKLVGFFLLGLAVSAGNPHYWIWWVTAGLAFVEAARSHGHSGLAWMLGALIGGVVAFYIPLLWALRHGKTFLSPRMERWVVVIMGIALLILGLGLLGIGAQRYYLASFG